MSKNSISLQLTFKITYKPNGTSQAALKDHLEQMVIDAMSNGTLTGETPAEVETTQYDIEIVN